MLNLRDKDISLIKNFFKLSTLQSNGYIPFIIAGTENGSGHNMIIRKVQQNKVYDAVCFITCHEFVLDAFRPIYQIIKIVSSAMDKAGIEPSLEIVKWLADYENEIESKHSENFLARMLSEYLTLSSKQKSIVIIIENLHFGSYFLLNFLDQVVLKMESSYPRLPLNILAFYRFEEFIDISLKKLIAEISEKGMAITVRNVPQHEYQIFLEPLFCNVSTESVQKLWQITRGNILIFSQILEFLTRKAKPVNGKFDLQATVELLPSTTRDFYAVYLTRFSRLENEILEAISFIATPIDQGFIEFLIKEPPQIIARAFRHLLKEKIISQTSFVNEKYNLISYDLKSYLLYRNNDEYKLGRYRYLLEKYETYHQHDLDKHLLVLRNLSIQAVDKNRVYKYLKMLYVTLPSNYNSFRRIEILHQLVMYETDTTLLTDCVIKLSCSLIEIGKYKSASEILVKYGSEKNIKTVDRFRIYLLLFELYISMEYYSSSAKIYDILDQNFNKDYPKYLLGMYYQSKINYFTLTGKYNEALKVFSIGVHECDLDREFYLLLKSEVLIRLGYINNARHILLEIYSIVEGKDDYFQLCSILLKLGHLELQSGNFDKSDQYYKSCQNFIPFCEAKNKFPVQVFIGLSNINLVQGNFKLARNYLYDALNIETTRPDPLLDSEIFCSLGRYYAEVNSFEKAISCFKKAKYNHLGYENIKKRIFYTLELAECYAKFNFRENSEKYYSEIEKLISEDRYPQHKDSFYLSKARSAMYLKEFDNALTYLENMLCQESDRIIFIEKTLLEMQIGYQIRNNALIKDSADYLKPFFSEFGSYILYQMNWIKNETLKQHGNE